MAGVLHRDPIRRCSRAANRDTLSAAAVTAAPQSVVVVARPGDTHADIVGRELDRRQVRWTRISLNTLASSRLAWRPGGSCRVVTRGGTVTIGTETTVWWRRPGWLESPTLAGYELALARDESNVLVPGVLVSVGPRWVDHPVSIAGATKPVQLSLASQIGVPAPETLITNDPKQARAFISEGPTVAKCVSTGPGLAPFVAQVPASASELVAAAPVLLQRLVDAEADLRIVTIGRSVMAWRRERSASEPVDWRQADPAGKGFRSVETPDGLADAALSLASGLDLSMSVQDWLATPCGAVFLEANPQGQWLFLDRAAKLVPPVLALHLIGYLR